VGRIVKGHGHVVAKVALDAHAEAEALLAAARAEADRIRAAAEDDRAVARREGREAGRAEGLAELAALTAAARADEEQRQREARPVALTLAVKMAERIVGRAVDLAPEVMADIAGAALETSRARGGVVKLRLHPEDLAATSERREALAARALGASALAFVADEAVGRYGCVVETAHGRVDARLESQLAALEQALTERPRG
jgi:flagellar biosynthesis/type III secretory pathway protein FliH